MNDSTVWTTPKDAIQVAIADAGRRGEVREYGSILDTADAFRKLERRLGRSKDLHFVYEAARVGTGRSENSRKHRVGC